MKTGFYVATPNQNKGTKSWPSVAENHSTSTGFNKDYLSWELFGSAKPTPYTKYIILSENTFMIHCLHELNKCDLKIQKKSSGKSTAHSYYHGSIS